MYDIDEKDAVVAVSTLPQQSVGAPCPAVFSDGHNLRLAYYLENVPTDWDGRSVRVIAPDTVGEPSIVLTFQRPRAHCLGPPNDEALSGHPLAPRGLRPYGVFEVISSSWIRTLVRRNRVHPYHKDDAYAADKHYIFTFHDELFECIAQGFTFTLHEASVSSLLAASVSGAP